MITSIYFLITTSCNYIFAIIINNIPTFKIIIAPISYEGTINFSCFVRNSTIFFTITSAVIATFRTLSNIYEEFSYTPTFICSTLIKSSSKGNICSAFAMCDCNVDIIYLVFPVTFTTKIN